MSSPIQLEQSVDPTGALSTLDLQGQDISNIMDQFNALQDQLNGGNITQNSQNIIVFDDTTNRVLIGYQTVLQTWGLFVSQVGVDVTQATADQLIFNSNQDIFKIALSGSDTASLTNTGELQVFHTIPHNLGLIPAVQAYVSCDNDFSALTPFPTYVPGRYTATPGNIYTEQSIQNSATTMPVPIFSINIMADDTNIYISYFQLVFSSGQVYNYSVNYYILQESAASS